MKIFWILACVVLLTACSGLRNSFNNPACIIGCKNTDKTTTNNDNRIMEEPPAKPSRKK